MKVLCSLLFLLLMSAAHAQYFNVTEMATMNAYGMKNIYPRFSMPKARAQADSINSDLIREVPAIAPDSATFGGSYDNLTFDIIRNDRLSLCLSFSYEACGAYCENYTEYYSYDSRTGKRVKTSQLFTDKGIQLLADTISSMKRDTINTYLKGIQKVVHEKEEQYTEEEIDGNMIYDMLSACIDQYDTADIDNLSFELAGESFSVILPRCSNHAMRADDPFWEYRYTFVARDWKKYLSGYGKYIYKL